MVILLVIGIILMVLLILATIVGVVVYSGLFTGVHVGAGPPPIQSVTVAYKFGRGPYKDTGFYFTEMTSIAPDNRCLAVYYDDPKQVPAEKLRWATATVLAEGFEMVDAELWSLFRDKGYRLFQFPLVSNAVRTSFPYRTPLSIFLGIWKVYPRLGQYVKEKKLCAHPWMEIYEGNIIHYMAPLSKQDEFYVPEALSEEVPEDGEHLHPKSTPLIEAMTASENAKDTLESPILDSTKGLARESASPLSESAKCMEHVERTAVGAFGPETIPVVAPNKSVHGASEHMQKNKGHEIPGVMPNVTAADGCIFSALKPFSEHVLPGEKKVSPSKTPEKSPDLQDCSITSTNEHDDSCAAMEISAPASPAFSDMSVMSDMSMMSGYTETSAWSGSSATSHSVLTEYSGESEDEHPVESGSQLPVA